MKRLIILALCFSLTGCAFFGIITKENAMTMDKTELHRTISLGGINPNAKDIARKELIRRHPEWSEQVKSGILNGKILIGMTKEQVLASWGEPGKINRSVGTWGVHEQWVYGGCSQYRCNYNYLYFEEEILTSWQD